MIRECEDHGYFRDEKCPYCGEEGKFMMSDYEVEKVVSSGMASTASTWMHRDSSPSATSSRRSGRRIPV